MIGVLLCLLLPVGFGSCLQTPTSPILQNKDSIVIITDSIYEELLDIASYYADTAYSANVHGRYELALQYIDTAMMFLNEHYEKYAHSNQPHRHMKLVGEGIPCRNMVVE